MSADISEQPDPHRAAGPTRDPTPRVIKDRYQVIRGLGKGSSAETLLCLDLQEDRRVAVKELHFQHLDDWKHLDLFAREARVMAMLDHRGIPKVFEFLRDQGEEATLFLVQEYVEGVSLEGRMVEGPLLGEEEVFDLTLGLLDVLEYLHSRTPPVLHRDIKPSNILVRDDGSPVLIDFGGVCFGWRPPDHTGTTVVGTSGFMPLEQFLGQAGPSSDLYSLGATLLHLVTGVPPHEFPFDSGRIEVPSDLPVRDSLRRMMEAVLRPAPRDRPQSAAAAREVLLTGKPVVAIQSQETGVTVHSGGIRRTTLVVSGQGPRFVEMGPAPRETSGPFSDVWKNLVDPLFPARPPGSGNHQFSFALAALMSLGIVAIWYSGKKGERKGKYGDIFRTGESTRGWIVSVKISASEWYASCTYDFDVDGVTYRDLVEYSAVTGKYWNEGDTVSILYDPEDPRRSCIVFR